MFFQHSFSKKPIYIRPICHCCNKEINDNIDTKCICLNNEYIHIDCFYEEVGQIYVEEGEQTVCACCGQVVDKVCDTYSLIEWQPVCQNCIEEHYEVYTPMAEEI